MFFFILIVIHIILESQLLYIELSKLFRTFYFLGLIIQFKSNKQIIWLDQAFQEKDCALLCSTSVALAKKICV